MPVEIISVGSEFLVQDYRNSRIATIANLLLEVGIEVDYVSSVSAQEARLEEILRQAIKRSTLIFVTGEVISGEYDVIKKLLTRVLKKRLVLNYRILDKIREQFELRGEVMPRTAEKRALVPTDADILENEVGTMPGFLFSQEDTHVVLLPGNALEINAMLKKHILPGLDVKTFRFGSVGGLIVKACGLPMSQIKDRLKNLDWDTRYQTVNYVADGEETSIIVTVRGGMQKDVDLGLESTEVKIRKKLGNYVVYGTGSQTLEEVIGGLLAEKRETLAVAESCTGGLISSRLTNISGSSAYFDRAVVSYSNEAKISLLEIAPGMIEEYGAVSAETAMAMAEGVQWLARTSLGLAVTGIAGPSGGTPAKPVGLVYIALSSDRAETQWEKYKFSGDRLSIKNRAAQSALNMLRRHLLIED